MGERRRRLAQRRKAVGLSQERLAEVVAVDRSTVVRWERGETEPQPWHRPRLAKALGVSIEELAALLSEAGGGEPSDYRATVTLDQRRDGTEDSVRRRVLLAAGGVSAAHAATARPTRVLDALNVVVSGGADSLATATEHLDELATHYSQTVSRLPSTALYNELLAVRANAGRMLDRVGSAGRRRADLAVAAGRLSNLLAVVTNDLGDHAAALLWCRDAERRAGEGSLPDLAGWAWFTRATIAYYQGQASHSATLAERGQQAVPIGTAARAKLAAQEMRARAMLGDVDGARRASRHASLALAKLGPQAPDSGVFSIPQDDDPPYTATSLLLVNRYAEAAAAAERIVECVYRAGRSEAAVRPTNYARTLLILGLAYAGLRRADDAASAGLAALNGARPVWPTVVLAGRLDRALASVGTTEVAAYRARCASLTHEVAGGTTHPPSSPSGNA